VTSVLRRAHRDATRLSSSNSKHRALAEHARAELVRTVDDSLSLGDLATRSIPLPGISAGSFAR
jgi:hypothetical protein